MCWLECQVYVDSCVEGSGEWEGDFLVVGLEGDVFCLRSDGLCCCCHFAMYLLYVD